MSVSRSPRRFSTSPGRRSDSRDRENKTLCTVSRINVDRGFGFLRVDDSSEEIFFHSNDIEGGMDIRKLREGDEVECTTQESKKRREAREATRVWVLDREKAEARDEIGRRPSPRRRGRRSPSRSYRRSRSRGRRSRSYRRSRSRGRREQGYVLRINERGFGFLQCKETDEEIFFHTHHLADRIDIRQLRRDDKVEFTTCESDKFPGKREANRVWVDDIREVERREQRGRRPARRRSRDRSASFSRRDRDRRGRRSYSR